MRNHKKNMNQKLNVFVYLLYYTHTILLTYLLYYSIEREQVSSLITVTKKHATIINFGSPDQLIYILNGR